MSRTFLACAALLLTACGGQGAAGTFELPEAEAQESATAYIAVVVADPEGEDLAEGAGEHVVIRNNWDMRADLGGWYVEDADEERLPLGIGRQLEAEAELRVHTACGEDGDAVVFACRETEVLDDAGDVLVLRDSAGGEVMRFAYGQGAG